MPRYNAVQCKDQAKLFYVNGRCLWITEPRCIVQGLLKNLAEFDLTQTKITLDESGIFYKRVFLNDSEKGYELIFTFWVYKKLKPLLQKYMK